MIISSGLFAQTLTLSTLPELLRYDSIVSFDQSNNHIEKGTNIYTIYGFPIRGEYYTYTNGNAPELQMKIHLKNDKGDEFTTIDSMFTTGEVMETQSFLDNYGNMTKQVMKTSQGSITVLFNNYYGVNNRIDSIHIITSGRTLQEYIYTYDDKDLPILTVIKIPLMKSTAFTDHTYIHNTDNKLESKISESFTYVDGILDTVQNRKEVLFYDNLERPLRNEIYTWDTQKNDYKEQYDTYSIRYYKTNTNIVEYNKLSDIPVTVSVNNGLLTIDSPSSERIEIYSMIGSCLYTDKKLSGQSLISLPPFPHGIYVIRGSSGWTKKICIQ
jgi:hypothetical protein